MMKVAVTLLPGLGSATKDPAVPLWRTICAESSQMPVRALPAAEYASGGQYGAVRCTVVPGGPDVGRNETPGGVGSAAGVLASVEVTGSGATVAGEAVARDDDAEVAPPPELPPEPAEAGVV